MSGEMDVGSSTGVVFINAPPKACSAFDFSALTGALQSEVFMGHQSCDGEPVADVFVPGVSLFSYMLLRTLAC